MSTTTRKGVSTSKRKHDSRNTSEATFYASKAYMRPMVAIKAQIAELNLREQVIDLLETRWEREAYDPWRTRGSEREWHTSSRGYRFVEPMRMAEWELELIVMRQEYAKRKPAIEHVIPRERRLNTLNVTSTVAELREIEAQEGHDSPHARMLRSRVERERKEALKRESVTRFGYVPALR
jgi:hypothetical protein